MTRAELLSQILKKQSFLCVGLDTDLNKIPGHLGRSPDAIVEFNKAIIDATHPYCVAYKLNTAFYEALGQAGWEVLGETLASIPEGCLTIADAKRADIGNTSERYAFAFFKSFSFDAITVAPYMGFDSVSPFLSFRDKWTILLALTSNPGSKDFQLIEDANGKKLFERVLEISSTWAGADQLMYVVGATHPDALRDIRAIVPDHFLLIPGVGAQGGDLETVARAALNGQVGILINASRSILYPGKGEDFASASAEEAQKMQKTMSALLVEKGLTQM